MSTTNGEKPDTGEFLAALYNDPLREETSRTGRVLVIVGLITVAVVIFQAKLEPTSLFPVSFAARPDVLPMMLSLVVLLLVVSFVLKASTDLLHNREANLLIVRYLERNRIDAAKQGARAVDQQMSEQEDEGNPEADPWWEEVIKIQQSADARVKELEGRLGLRTLPRALRRIRLISEMTVPVIVGVAAAYLSFPHLWELAQAIAASY